jgi:hypothetical protein
MNNFKWFWLMILATFTNDSFIVNNTEIKGFSWRKIAGLTGLVTAVIMTLNNVETTTYLATLYSWQIFISVCIGLVTVPQLIESLTKLKIGNTQ